MEKYKDIFTKLNITKQKLLSDIADYGSQDILFIAGSLVENMVSIYGNGMGE